MNVLLVSQCSKNALKETRRVLDQFAERRGDRTWQTPITMDGLITLRKLLKKTARKNTAVACHWIRGKDHSELIWVVGDSGRFSAEGAVPTNTTDRDVLRSNDENQWHTAEAISLLAGIAGLFHDFGKANKLFQQKLKPNSKGKGSEPVRHEWVSLRLFQAFIGDLGDSDWLGRLHQASPAMEADLLDRLVTDQPGSIKNPFRAFAERPLAMMVAWLIVTHHRLPEFPRQEHERGEPRSDEVDQWLAGKQFNASWNSPQFLYTDWKPRDWQEVWSFPQGTPLSSRTWCDKAQSLGKRGLAHKKLVEQDWLQDRFTSHLARLVLMLADHCYSASAPTLQWQDKRYKSIANTDRETRQPKQKLDEHNIGVGHNAVLMARRLPGLRKNLPAVTRLKALKKRVTVSRFRWQDKAYDLAISLSQRSEQQGFFGVNMASTGCGKTFANARIMYGLANERTGCRFNVALGLRTLTLQTGDAFRDKLHLDSEDMAVLVGSQAVRQLHEQRIQEADEKSSRFAQSGSESAEELLSQEQHLRYEGSLDDGQLSEWLQRDPRLHQLVSAPVLVSTIDYLMPATEGSRGGRQIAPMLRLLTSDLVLDEPDDFGLEDLPALCRLVNWAGMLGSRVLLSSATLPPALVQALFDAYVAGHNAFNAACGQPGVEPAVPCAWFDEFGIQQSDHLDAEQFKTSHELFVGQRIQKLAKENQQLRYARLLPVTPASRDMDDVVEAVTQTLHSTIFKLHDDHHSVEVATGKTASFGLVRMANIIPLVAVARALLALPVPADYRLHFCVYHGQYPLLMRSRIEVVLDSVLDRNDETAFWSHPVIGNALSSHPETHHVFLVLGSSVTEVGRDHDYDWAIAEPSSMRSLIQLAGRIQRHRCQPPETPNLLILTRSIRALKGEPVAYTRPGFESKDFSLASWDLAEILQTTQYEYISAVPRIRANEDLDAQHNLVDLEHAHLQARLFGHTTMPFHASLWWQHNPTWCCQLQQKTPFRQSGPEERFVLYQEDETETPEFRQVLPDGSLLPQSERFQAIDLDMGERISAWVETDPRKLIDEMAEKRDLELADCSLKFTEIRLREGEAWNYHPLLGVFGKP
ncbi:MAG TPA: type I-F CRISPR-associated helicase Cas3f [Marinobacter sp.]|nr:type I-F CRISPR-associated helicase Cas3f [Marinobacter sp.]